jgi:peptide-methionine (R)-S-oxide reductase
MHPSDRKTTMTRRTLMNLFALFGIGAGAASASPGAQAAEATGAAGGAKAGAGRSDRVQKTDAEWRQQLPAAAYDVLRHEGTERPWSSALNTEKRAGQYACAGCGLALFASGTKFDSGTGWPSFFQPLAGAVETRTDYKLILPRTEYHCARCGGHQGHVFNDGPRPTGQRYCNNGVALRFEAQAG